MRDADEDGDEGGGAEARSVAELRLRIDGFTPERQKKFLKWLGRTGCVRDAARKAGISTTTVDRTRRNFPDFDAKCRAAHELSVPKLEAIAYQRATAGAPEKVIRRGKVVQIRLKPSDAMLRLLLAGAAPQKYGRVAGRRQAAREATRRSEWWRRPRLDGERRASILRKLGAMHRHRLETGQATEGPGGILVPAGYRMVTEEELARLGWTPPEAAPPPNQEDGS